MEGFNPQVGAGTSEHERGWHVSQLPFASVSPAELVKPAAGIQTCSDSERSEGFLQLGGAWLVSLILLYSSG